MDASAFNKKSGCQNAIVNINCVCLFLVVPIPMEMVLNSKYFAR